MSLPGIYNVGKVLEVSLKKAGIDSFEKLCEIGTEKAFLKLYANNKNTSKSILFALEGAIQEIRWHNLDKKRKTQLTKFFNSVKANKE